MNDDERDQNYEGYKKQKQLDRALSEDIEFRFKFDNKMKAC